MFDEVLYICCEEMEAPDWSGFSSLELGGGRCFDDGVPQNLVFATEAEFLRSTVVAAKP